MLTTVFSILFVMPLLVRAFTSRKEFENTVHE
jgi:hypothetical protein